MNPLPNQAQDVVVRQNQESRNMKEIKWKATITLMCLTCCAELSLHYLAKAKIMVVRDVERDDIEFISKVSRCAFRCVAVYVVHCAP